MDGESGKGVPSDGARGRADAEDAEAAEFNRDLHRDTPGWALLLLLAALVGVSVFGVASGQGGALMIILLVTFFSAGVTYIPLQARWSMRVRLGRRESGEALGAVAIALGPYVIWTLFGRMAARSRLLALVVATLWMLGAVGAIESCRRQSAAADADARASAHRRDACLRECSDRCDSAPSPTTSSTTLAGDPAFDFQAKTDHEAAVEDCRTDCEMNCK
jgi:hypothetical protein